MAEAVFKHTVKQKGLESRFNIDSAGTEDYHVGGIKFSFNFHLKIR